MRYHYITVPGHPSDICRRCKRYGRVPLHYSSGHPSDIEHCIMTNMGYHYITVPGHPSDCVCGPSVIKRYHYITVPGHPSDTEAEKTAIEKYHYITVPGHPSDVSYVLLNYRF